VGNGNRLKCGAGEDGCGGQARMDTDTVAIKSTLLPYCFYMRTTTHSLVDSWQADRGCSCKHKGEGGGATWPEAKRRVSGVGMTGAREQMEGMEARRVHIPRPSWPGRRSCRGGHLQVEGEERREVDECVSFTPRQEHKSASPSAVCSTLVAASAQNWLALRRGHGPREGRGGGR
jgi:hypothetical protein